MSDCARAISTRSWRMGDGIAPPSNLALSPTSYATISGIQTRPRRFTVRLSESSNLDTAPVVPTFSGAMCSVRCRMKRYGSHPISDPGTHRWAASVRQKTGLRIAHFGPVEPAAIKVKSFNC